MEKLNELGVWWRGVHETLVIAIQNGWHPGRLENELAYKLDLHAFLREIVPQGVLVEKEYPHAGAHVDVWVKWPGIVFAPTEILIELKVDLQDMPQYDRLVGQLERVGVRDRLVIVVLCGDTDPRFVARLRQAYDDVIHAFPVADSALAIIEKSDAVSADARGSA